MALSPCWTINQPAAAAEGERGGESGERDRARGRERMAMDWPTHSPPALVPAAVSAGAVLVSHYVFNVAAQVPDPAVRLFYLESSLPPSFPSLSLPL